MQPPNYNGPPPYQQQQPYYPPPQYWTPKNYTTNAVVTLFLYFLFWLPGVIVNCIYLYDAWQTKEKIGHEPQGMGCLWALFAFFTVVPILFFIVVLLLGFLGAGLH